MTTPVGCPACAAPLRGGPECPSCGLPLTGPNAQRLWVVDQQLAGLARQVETLTDERAALLEHLRRGDLGAPTAPTVLPAWPQQQPQPPRESSPVQVQNTLLTLGALLLAVAGVVFTVVTYRNLGVVGRALVLLALTGAAAWAPTVLVRRRLTASAEAVATVGAVLLVLDAYALRRAGLVPHTEALSYWSVATSVLAGLLALYGTYVPLRSPRFAAASLAQLPLPLLLDRVDATASLASVVLAGQAGADLYTGWRTPLPRDVRRLLTAFGGLLCFVALVASAGAVHEDESTAWTGFAALACLATAAWWLADEGVQADAAALAVVPLVGAAAWAAARPTLTGAQQPLVPAAVAILALQAIALLPRSRREGAAFGALGVAAVAVLVEAKAVAQALAGPLTWLVDPWTRTAGDARGALGVDLRWSGTVVTLAVLAAAAVATVTTGLVLDRLRAMLAPAAVLLVLSAVTLPLGLATSYRDALAQQLGVAVALGAAGAAALGRNRLVGLALCAAGVATGLLAAAWSVADENATLVLLPVVAVLCVLLAVLVAGGPTALALLLGAAALAALGAHRDLAADQVGGLLLLAVAGCVAMSFVLRDVRRLEAELASALVAVAGIACAAGDPGWLSWTLAGAGLAALAVSVRPDRRVAGLLGGLLLSASSWVRLADAHVHAPEPYVAPIAAAALVAGLLRRRSHPTAGSWECYGTGLVLALTPSLLRSLADPTPTRGLVLLVVAVGVVVLGGHARLQAPLAIGAVVVAVDAVALLAPYASALPRWTLLAAAGLLLVILGATYEARLRDLQRLRARYDALS